MLCVNEYNSISTLMQVQIGAMGVKIYRIDRISRADVETGHSSVQQC